MSLAIVHSRAQVGVEACVSVEAHLANGLPSLTLVGLPETAVRESKDRVRSALLNAGFDFPARRITLNLAPPTYPRTAVARPGHRTRHPRRQRPVARHRPRRPGVPRRTGPVRGDPPSARRIAGRAGGARRKARSGGTEGKCRRGQPGQRADGVRRGPPAGDRRTPLRPGPAAALPGPRPAPRALPLSRPGRGQGQAAAKRALLVAAAGANLLLSGPPGTGKTLLASRLPGLLPALDEDEALEVAAIHSVASHVPSGTGRSDRSASRTTPPPRRPGRRRQPPAAGRDHPGAPGRAVPRRTAGVRAQGPGGPARAAGKRRDRHCPGQRPGTFPGALPTGGGDESLSLWLPRRSQWPLPLHGTGPALPGQAVRTAARSHRPARQRAPRKHQPAARTRRNRYRRGQRVGAARQRQLARQGCANAHLDLQAMHRNCALAEADRRWLEAAGERLELSLRALHRILKVARTLADLERIDAIERRHLAEALQYRARPPREA